jgi:AcrR family transcriptional regulator
MLTRQQQQEQTRERLLDSAAAVFARRGYHGAKVAEIAREAGFTTGAVYSNFDGKQDLFVALTDRQMERRMETVSQIAAAVDLPDVADAAIAAQFEDFLDESGRWAFLFVEFWAQVEREDDLGPEWRERRDAVRDAIADGLASVAAARGRTLALPAPELASAIRGVLNGLTFERTIDSEQLPGRAAVWALRALLEAATRPS